MGRKLGRHRCALLAAGNAAGAGGIQNPGCRRADYHFDFPPGLATIKRTTKPHNQADAQGKPVKALSPNCRGGSFTGRRQTAATPLAPPSERVAGKHTGPAGVHPPPSCERPSALAACNAHPECLRHQCRPCAQFRSRFCLRVWIGAQACASRHPRQTTAASRNGEHARTDQSAQTAADGLPTARVQSAVRHNLSNQNSRERKIWPARLRFACCRQRRGLPQLIAL